MNTYGEYLKHKAGNIITIEECMEIYSQMVESISKCELEDKMDFWNSFIEKASRYTFIRNQWETMTNEERAKADESRTMAHNSLIASINVLARLAEKENKDNSWRNNLGDERKRIGDFACFVASVKFL